MLIENISLNDALQQIDISNIEKMSTPLVAYHIRKLMEFDLINKLANKNMTQFTYEITDLGKYVLSIIKKKSC